MKYFVRIIPLDLEVPVTDNTNMVAKRNSEVSDTSCRILKLCMIIDIRKYMFIKVILCYVKSKKRPNEVYSNLQFYIRK